MLKNGIHLLDAPHTTPPRKTHQEKEGRQEEAEVGEVSGQEEDAGRKEVRTEAVSRNADAPNDRRLVADDWLLATDDADGKFLDGYESIGRRRSSLRAAGAPGQSRLLVPRGCAVSRLFRP